MIYEGDRPTEIHNKLTIFLEGIFRQKMFGPHTRKWKKKTKTDAATVSINNNKKILLILIFKGFNKLENACTQIAYSRQQALHAFCPYVRDISNQFELKPFSLDVRLKLSLVQPPFFPTTKCWCSKASAALVWFFSNSRAMLIEWEANQAWPLSTNPFERLLYPPPFFSLSL